MCKIFGRNIRLCKLFDKSQVCDSGGHDGDDGGGHDGDDGGGHDGDDGGGHDSDDGGGGSQVAELGKWRQVNPNWQQWLLIAITGTE